MYDLTDPPLDFHLARQLRSAVIARSVYYQLNTNLNPELRQQATNLATLEVYEPPILENIVGFTYFLVGGEYLWISRIYLALFWAIGGWIIYLFGKRYASTWAVLLGLAFYFFLPSGVIASRAFLPDSWMVMWILLTTYAAVRWQESKSWKWALITGGLGAVTLVIKIVSGFFVAGVMVAVVFGFLGFKFFRSCQVWSIAGLMLVPPTFIYLILNPQRSAGFMSFWTVSLSGLIRTSGFYADWLAMIKSLMGLTIIIAALIGVFLADSKTRPYLIGLWIGYTAYGLFFPYQYTTHEYYHLPLYALVGLSIIPLLETGIAALQKQPVVWRLAAAGVFLCAMGYSLYVARSILYARDYRSEVVAWEEAGQAIPENSSFIALTADYGMRLRYYGWRSMTASWPASNDLNLFALAGNQPLDVESYFNEFALGKDYFVITAFGELDAQPQLKEILEKNYPIYSQGDGYLVYDLKKSK